MSPGQSEGVPPPVQMVQFCAAMVAHVWSQAPEQQLGSIAHTAVQHVGSLQPGPTSAGCGSKQLPAYWLPHAAGPVPAGTNPDPPMNIAYGPAAEPSPSQIERRSCTPATLGTIRPVPFWFGGGPKSCTWPPLGDSPNGRTPRGVIAIA